MRIGRKSYLDFQIAEVEQELKAVSREIRAREKMERRARRISGYGLPAEREGDDQDDLNGKRLASYLSAGSFQTIAHPKFRSDLVRRRRLLIGGGVVGLLAAAWIVWRLLL